MMTIQEARLQFLNDVVFYYGSNINRRAIEGPSYCSIARYKTDNGKKCPIGRLIKDHHKPEELFGSVKHLKRETDNGVVNECIEKYIPMDVYLLGKNFLNEIQSLHDEDSNWFETGGLTSTGSEKYNYIVKNYCSDYLEYEFNF